jgi:hypothetical protein
VDVIFLTPSAPYEKSKFLGSGGSMVARLKLKEIDGRAPPGVNCRSLCARKGSRKGKVVRHVIPSGGDPPVYTGRSSLQHPQIDGEAAKRESTNRASRGAPGRGLTILGIVITSCVCGHPQRSLSRRGTSRDLTGVGPQRGMMCSFESSAGVA